MVVVHNMLASNTCRQFNINNRQKNKTVEKLSSGYKINRSADDAAGLSISEKMRNQIRNLSQATNNSQDGISLIQTADGAMAEVHSMLQRMTELCTQAANDTLNEEDRDSIQKEINEILVEIDEISEKTTFNDRFLLQGSNGNYTSSTTPPVISGGLPAWGSIDSASQAAGLMSETYNLADGDHAATLIDFSAFDSEPDKSQAIADAIDSGFYTTCCTCSNHYSIKFTDQTTHSVEQSGSHYVYNVGIGDATSSDDIYNKILDATSNGHPNNHFTEMVVENGKLVVYDNRPDVTPYNDYGKIGEGIATSSGGTTVTKEGTLYLQVGANAGENMMIELPALSTNNMGITNIDVSSHESASNALKKIYSANNYVSGERSRMGAYQNRLEFTVNSLENYHENLSAAESSIRDANMADEITNNSKLSILEQAGQAMLTQANQQHQSVLSLLQ